MVKWGKARKKERGGGHGGKTYKEGGTVLVSKKESPHWRMAD